MSPPPVTTDYDTIITQVRVTLSSRSSLQRIQGATTAATGPAALRGQLVATGTPRAALFAVNQQPQPTPVWR
jgi:hypothetical protein